MLLQVCLEICEVVAKTVDGSKTGYTPDNDMKKGFSSNKVPDFHEHAGHASKEIYPSENALGHLFRQWEKFAQSFSSESFPGCVWGKNDFTTTNSVDHNLQEIGNHLWQTFVGEIDTLKFKHGIESDLHLFVPRLPKGKFDIKNQLRADLRRIGIDIRRQFRQHQGNTISAYQLACYYEAKKRPEIVTAVIMCLPIATQYQPLMSVIERTGYNILMQSPISSQPLKEFLREIKDTNITQEIEANDWLIVATAMICEMYPSYPHANKVSLIKRIIAVGKDINVMANPLQVKGDCWTKVGAGQRVGLVQML